MRKPNRRQPNRTPRADAIRSRHHRRGRRSTSRPDERYDYEGAAVAAPLPLYSRLAITAGRTLRFLETHLGPRLGPFLPTIRPAAQMWREARPYILVLLLSSFVVSRWVRTGTFIATGDVGPLIRRGWQPEVTWSWNHQMSGAGSASYPIVRAFEFLLIGACKFVGLGEYSAQWLFYTCIYGLVGFGVAYFAGAFVRNEFGVVVAGAFGILNGFFLTRLPNPLNIISVGEVAFLTGIAMRVALGKRVATPIAGFALMPSSFLSFNPPMLVVAFAWAMIGTPVLALLTIGKRPAAKLLWWLVRATPMAVILNVWWLTPLAQGFLGGGGSQANTSFTDPTNWSWSQVNNLPPNILTMVANWAWFRGQYFPFTASLDEPWWIWIRYLLPALVFASPVLALRSRRRLAFGVLGFVVFFVVLAKGLRPPFIGFNLLLYEYVPGFWLFREPMSKLGQLLVAFFGLLLAVAVEGLVHRLRRINWHRRTLWLKRAAYTGAFAPVLLVLAYPHPLYTGAVIPDERPSQPSAHVRVPQEWWDIAERIDADKRPGKVLVLPLDDYYQMPTTWGFFGVDSIANLLVQHPVVQRQPDGYFGDGPGFASNVQAVETALVSGDLEPVPRLLAAIGVSKVIIRHDLVRGLPNRYFADDRVLAAAMARTPQISLVSSGMLDLWQAGDGSSPTVRTYDRVLDVPGRPDAGSAVIGTVDTRTGVAARVNTALPTTSPHVDDSLVSTADVVQWPVPAVDDGPATTTVTVAQGRYTLAQRARAAAVLTPRVDRANHQLLFSDHTTVAIDGVPLSSRPTLSVPLPDKEIVALRANTRTISLDGWGRAADAPTATVPVGSATALTLFSAAEKPARPTPYSDVFDCNNYEPRPAAELGLAKEEVEEDGHKVVRLTALDHAACSTVKLPDAAPGRTYRIRLEYRQVSGARPQICILQTGAEGCELAPRQVASDQWTPFERFVTVDSGSTGLQLLFHADVGERLRPATTSEYRDLRIDALEPASRQTLWPPVIAPVTVELAEGEHELRVDGGQAGSVLAPFEPLEDCFRYDDSTPEQAGLVGDVTQSADGDTTYTLGAVRHLACIGANATDFGAASIYELSLEARTVAVRNPKFCVYLRGPDRCRTMPAVALWDDWTTYQALFGPDPAAVETRLYLYGMRDPKEKTQSQVEYRQVKLRAVASPVSVVLVRQAEPDETTDPTNPAWHRDNPANFTVSVPGPTVVGLAENAAPGWAISATKAPGAEKVTLEGWMNGWRLPAGASHARIGYGPSMIARYALYILPMGVTTAAVWAGFLRWYWVRHGRQENFRLLRPIRRWLWRRFLRLFRRLTRRGVPV